MSIPIQHEPDDDTLGRYLLGTLPEAEAERVDELSITDDALAARLRAVEYDLIEAYARGELSADTLARFRSRCVSSPVMREKVRFAETLAAYQARPATAHISASRERRWFVPAVPQWRLAAAALLALAAAGYLLVENVRVRDRVAESRPAQASLEERERQLRRELDERRWADAETTKELTRVRESLAKLEARIAAKPLTGRQVLATFLLVPSRRGAGDLSTIAIPRGTDAVTLRLELEADDFTRYRVTLKDPANDRSLWRSAEIKSTTAGGIRTVNVTVTAALLKPDNYILELTGLTATGAARFAGRSAFRVGLP